MNATPPPPVPEIIDIGVNLTHESFAADCAATIAAAQAAGVSQMIVTGTDLPATRAAVDLAARFPGTLFATAGVHPHHASNFGAGTEPQLRDLAEHALVVAIGECGLDYFRNFSPPADQRRAFARQLTLAADTGLPVFLHQRDAHADFRAIVEEYRGALSAGVAHCFTGGLAELEDYLALGLHIGVTGWVCDERRGSALVEAVPRIPDNRLMIETDAPYLLPRDLRPTPKSRRNEPGFLPHILERISALRHTPAAVTAAQTTANARRFFSLPAPTPQSPSR